MRPGSYHLSLVINSLFTPTRECYAAPIAGAQFISVVGRHSRETGKMQQIGTSTKKETIKSREGRISHSLPVNGDDASDKRSRSRTTGHWSVRLARGARCGWQLNRNDASPLVHALWNFGESNAAVKECKRIIAADPANAYAYIHLIDLLIGQFKDFNKAEKYYRKGMTELHNADSRELLESFYLYTCWVHFPIRRLLARLSRN